MLLSLSAATREAGATVIAQITTQYAAKLNKPMGTARRQTLLAC